MRTCNPLGSIRQPKPIPPVLSLPTPVSTVPAPRIQPNRRDLLKGASALSLAATVGRGEGRPNILLIMVDQHRHDLAGYAGSGYATTPYLDALAAESVRIESCYAAVPLCAPARQSLVTGQYASTHGTFRNRHAEVDSERTVFHDITSGGYHTGWFGKTHCNVSGFGQVESQDQLLAAHAEKYPGALPAGAERIITDQPTAVPFMEPYNTRYEDAGTNHPFHMEEHVTRQTLAALKQRPKDKPFLMVASYLSPHPPLFPPKDFLELYRNADLPMPSDRMMRKLDLPNDLGRRRRTTRMLRVSEPMARNATRAYYASLAWTDHCMGQLLAGLEEQKLSDSTLVIYTSDHGETLGEHGIFGKRSFFEAASRVHLMVRQPGVLPQGVVRERVASHLDLTASLTSWTGTKNTHTLPGRPLQALLAGDPDLAWKDEARMELTRSVGLPEVGELTLAPGDAPPTAGYWCLRRGNWKYSDFGGGQRYLFDLNTDPNERLNRIDDSTTQDVADEMAASLHQGSPKTWAFHKTESGQEGAPK